MQGFFHSLGDGGKRNAATQKRLDCYLVGSVEGTSGGSALFLRFVSQFKQAGQFFEIRCFEAPSTRFCPVESGHRHLVTSRVGHRVLDGHPHVRCGNLGNDAADRCTRPWRGWSTADERQRRLARAADQKQPACLDHFESVFMSVAESMVMRRPIFQVGCWRACSGVTCHRASCGVSRTDLPKRSELAS